MLTRLYTPETITESDFLLKVTHWYTRFDLFLGFQSGGEASLSRDWYVAVHDHYLQKVAEDPNNISMKYEERFAYSRLVAKDSGDLFARKAKGLLSDEAFINQLQVVSERVQNLDTIDPVLLESVEKITIDGSQDPDSPVNPYEANLLWGGDRWTSNYLLMDMYGIIFMHHISVSMAVRQAFDPSIVEKACTAAQLFEAIRVYKGAPPGSIIEAQATVAIAGIFLPKNEQWVNWMKGTFVNVETAGYVHYFSISRSCLAPLLWTFFSSANFKRKY
jgi:hypothetical protein